MTESRTPIYDVTAVRSLLDPIRWLTAEKLAALGPPPAPLPGFITFLDPGGCLRAMLETFPVRVFCPPSWRYPSWDHPIRKSMIATAQPCYRQLRMEAPPETLGKTWAEQVALLTDGKEVPTARVVFLGIVLHFRATGERLHAAEWVRTADVLTNGGRLCVGDFRERGITLFHDFDGGSSDETGLAVARKLS